MFSTCSHMLSSTICGVFVDRLCFTIGTWGPPLAVIVLLSSLVHSRWVIEPVPLVRKFVLIVLSFAWGPWKPEPTYKCYCYSLWAFQGHRSTHVVATHLHRRPLAITSKCTWQHAAAIQNFRARELLVWHMAGGKCTSTTHCNALS